MSIVLYALGAALLGWSGFMLLSDDSYATIDIAASLAGWGAFTVGLGAVAAALARLTRAVAGASPARRRPPLQAERKSEDADQIVPVFLPRGGGPAPVEPAPEPVLEAPLPLRPTPAPEVSVRPAPKPEPDPQSGPFKPKPEAAPAPERPPVVVVARPIERPAAREEPELTKRERRARRLAAREEAASAGDPSVSAPAPAGGFALDLVRGLRAQRADGAAPAETPKGDDGPEAAPKPVAPASVAPPPPDAPDAPRPIMPPRPGAPVRAAQIEPKVEPQPAAPMADAAPTPAPNPPKPAEDVDAAVRPTKDAAEPIAEPTQAAEPEAAAEPTTASRPQEPAPKPELEPQPPEPEAAAEPRPAPTVEPRVPDWLARARARREARAKAEAQDKDAPAAEPDPRPVFVPRVPVAAPDASGAEAEQDDPPAPQIVREGEHNGVLYRFFDDGSVEAVGTHGVRRFATVEELRSTVVAARGAEEPHQAERRDAPAPEIPEVEPIRDADQDRVDQDPLDKESPDKDPLDKESPDKDPLDKALAELEGRPAPELRIDPQDRLGPSGRR